MLNFENSEIEMKRYGKHYEEKVVGGVTILTSYRDGLNFRIEKPEDLSKVELHAKFNNYKLD